MQLFIIYLLLYLYADKKDQMFRFTILIKERVASEQPWWKLF